jgi:hypothetical protein
MAAESILTFRRPGFPRTTNNETAFSTVVEYIGPLTTLEAARPVSNASWGDYTGRVKTTELEPIEGTDKAIMVVILEYKYEAGTNGTEPGIPAEISLEVEWVMFQRSMYEHPVFAIGEGGDHALTSADIAAIEKWENEDNADEKALYKYKVKEDDTEYETLSANAKMFARGIELGQSSWEDYSPVVRKTTNMLGGPPGISAAGQKDNPPSFDGGPAGYQWRKSADRGIKAGGQTKWERQEEWLGAKKVLTDKDEIFWTAPA